MNIIWNKEDYLMHYGMPRRSGRYKWGSGKDPYHHGADSPRGRIPIYDRRGLKTKILVKQSEKALSKGKTDKARAKLNAAIDSKVLRYDRLTDSNNPPKATSSTYDRIYTQRNKAIDANNKRFSDVSNLPPNSKRTKEYMMRADLIDKSYLKKLMTQQIKDVGYKDIRKGQELLRIHLVDEDINRIKKGQVRRFIGG